MNKQEIIEALYKCAKIEHKTNGVSVERTFAKEADLVLELMEKEIIKWEDWKSKNAFKANYKSDSLWTISTDKQDIKNCTISDVYRYFLTHAGA